MKKFVAIILVLSIITLIATAAAEFYPRCAVVTDIDEAEDLVICEDFAGIVWEFYGIEDFVIGDLVAMILWDADTQESIFDDEIIDALYGGTNFEY